MWIGYYKIIVHFYNSQCNTESLIFPFFHEKLTEIVMNLVAPKQAKSRDHNYQTGKKCMDLNKSFPQRCRECMRRRKTIVNRLLFSRILP